MDKIKILTGFGHYSDADLEQKAELIVERMTNNPHFSSPVPDINEIKKAVQAFDQALIKAKEGSRVEVQKKKEKRQELTILLEQLALYVQMAGHANQEALMSSGFSVTHPKEKIGILAKPENFGVHPEGSGMIKLKLKAIKGAHSYRYEYRKVGEENWQVVVGTKSWLLLTDLQSGQQYQFRVAGVGVVKERIYSDILSSYIL